MKTLPPFPSASAYICTKGCGAESENKTSKLGVQNSNKMVKTKEPTPVAMAPVKIALPATTLRGKHRKS